MGTVRTKVNLVISVKDSFTGKSDYIGAISVRTKGGKTAIKKSGGNFVFVNLESENEDIIIDATFYQKQVLKANISDKCELMNVSLMPDEMYRFPPETMKIYGKLDRESFVQFGYSFGGKKIIEGCKKGDNSLRIYSDNYFDGGKIMLISGEKYHILSCKKGEKPLEYILDTAVNFNTDLQTQILDIATVYGRDNATYFLPLPKKPDKMYAIYGKKIKAFENISQNMNFDFE